MIVVTGAAGFIGSYLVGHLSSLGIPVVVVDAFDREDKILNLENKEIVSIVHRNHFEGWLQVNHRRVGHVFHLGARTDTTEFDVDVFDRLNLKYSQMIWRRCAQYEIPMTYASSAATYGDGSLGYLDEHDLVSSFEPLNPYGRSKNDFDLWALEQKTSPPRWYGLKFFNVYGPNEYHKGRMASVIFHAYHQIKQTGGMKLFQSHRKGIEDGHQSRDFVAVQDIVEICLWCLHQAPASGLYNAGTGKARTFLDLVKATFRAMETPENISFIPTPIDIRDKYQYFTEASTEKLKAAGFTRAFIPLEDGIATYVKDFLVPARYY